MNADEKQSGLRDLPLSQYFLRGMSSNVASQYQALRQLQEEQSTVVPLRCGPFRIFVYERHEEVLRAAGMDRSALLLALGHGFDVQRIEPADGQAVGRIVGSVNEGRVRIVLTHELDPPAPADWRLLGLDRVGHQSTPLAALAATWTAVFDRGSGNADGNAHATFSQCRGIQDRYRGWLTTWEPFVVVAPFLIFHLDGDLPKSTESDRLFSGLQSGTTIFACRKESDIGHGSREATLTLQIPEFRKVLTARRASFPDAGPNEWLVTKIDDELFNLVRVARLDVRCQKFTRHIRKYWRGAADAEAWAEQLRYCEARYAHMRDTGWRPPAVAGGSFNLRVSGKARDDLKREKLSPADLCEAMTRSMTVVGVGGRGGDEILAVTNIPGMRIRLTPYQPSVGPSDWTLVTARLETQSQAAFARVVADWQEGKRGQAALSGDATVLLQELAVLQTRRHGCEEEIRRIEPLAIGDTPELAERLRAWRRVCEMERDLLQVGVARMERSGQEYLLVPEELKAVKEWIEGLKSLNPERMVWSRNPLELRAGDRYARLAIRDEPSAGIDANEIVLKVGCVDVRGRQLADAVCDGQANEQVRLFLPDSQLSLIDTAMKILDPQRKSPAESQGVVGRDLMPDDQSLQTLRAILTGARGLAAKQGNWPPLPVAPLVVLSPAQEEAVRAAIFGPDMTLIQGPPGTGKTTVILEILRQLFRLRGRSRSFKVLLVAPTHVAVDNVLERLVSSRRGTSLVTELGIAPYRLGSTRRIAEHLRGFTPDCINSDYHDQIERKVAESFEEGCRKVALDREMLGALAAGAAHDATAWGQALETGELPANDWRSSWPAGLGADWRERVESISGRLEVWKHWNARGNSPERRIELLGKWLEFLRRNPRFFSELLVANANLVCGTTIGCATHRELRAASYDYVIVDEAGKEEARRLLVPLIRGERWVLVGDHQQLPPFADDDLKNRLVQEGLDPRTITRSLFEELQTPFEERGCYVFLDRQGRMHPDISAFVSQRFYGGKLRDFDHAAGHMLPRPRFLPDDPKLLILDTRRLPKRYETRRGTGYVNRLEQHITLLLLRAFARLDAWQEPLANDKLLDVPSIGVIAPYRHQVEELAQRVRKDPVLERLLRAGLLHIGTVDSFQGQERDLIVFTCTRSNPQGRLGFVDNRQRLNVALSRARSRLIVILDGEGVERSFRDGDVTGLEAETRDHLCALLTFSRSRAGVLEMPLDWQQCWRR